MMIDVLGEDISKIIVDDEWNFGKEDEKLMHSIHSYPAKFPAFIAKKAFEYAEEEGVKVETVSDIFCGCGTVALEAKLHNKNFCGYDINPVATLIAQAKSADYKAGKLEELYRNVIENVEQFELRENVYEEANERLKYWFSETSYQELYKLKHSIINNTPQGRYRKAFLCIFSSILKSTSRWLTKSIKPQIDPNKKVVSAKKAFTTQYNKFLRAVLELEGEKYKGKISIKNQNFLKANKLPEVDLIITSPPYVTSYEYADLHQLSSLWLGVTEDYKDLRKGSIGSVYNSDQISICTRALNKTGSEIVKELQKNAVPKAKIRSVIRYYSDMQEVVKRCEKMVSEKGMVFFVIGDTEYKGVKIQNSKHLIEALRDSNFRYIKATKRKISNKLCIPYRDETGKFSSDKTQREIYHEEWIISGRK
ncbi:site-specific DNA-methyltransferase [Ohessyouella blattaphilus]|uniref:site-specific DNA-methyltransferase (cytosine-N(4)-specific) n=1 Tax=Ohessyouella blattaphilus TaxID=2949333 RepID=A0ABT1EL84_9FIRM|nr:site-specific DNA-methyltransferase [Ohessyouella blattaphilus]MCP1111461.1 site-specific DNA-methyltransferase [Ohessyouella blattaphilus]MCR8564855.1 site-specific DNA-methyltransferase [Ohessyouella blattaphilus]